MPAPLQILVRKQRGRWSVSSSGRTFTDQLAAIKAGIDLANESGRNGRPAVVLYQAAKSRYRKVWTYGTDAYPPSRSGLPEICAAAPVTRGTGGSSHN
jgi:hypothetical protein